MNNNKVTSSFILKDHQEINESLAKKILIKSKENNADIITTEKDIVRLLGAKEGSFKAKLFVKSNVVDLNIEADEELLISDIENSLKLIRK
jgi:tetraacyldisaccharide-1-P 4'-kinase